MIACYERKSNITGGIGMAGIVLGILLMFCGGFVQNVLAPLILVAGWISVWFAMCYYASAKGYSALYGLLWILGLIGLIVLLVLPDLAKENPADEQPIVEPNMTY